MEDKKGTLFAKKTPNAKTPRKGTKESIGYDITCIELLEKKGDLYFYDTGISVQPPPGYYYKIFPRSSLAKTGYILANGVGIIDPDYTGSIKIALLKIDKDAGELVCPFVKFQLVLEQVNRTEFIKVEYIEETVRGSGGFGSTDKQPV